MTRTMTISDGTSKSTAGPARPDPGHDGETGGTKRTAKRSGMIIFAVLAMLMSTVFVQTATTEPAAAQGYCDAGYTLIGNTCYRCPNGYTLNHTSCSKKACPTQYSTNWGGWGSRACRRWISVSYWSGYVYSPKTKTVYASPYTAPKRSFAGAVVNSMSSGWNHTVNTTIPGAVDTYTNSTYHQNNCSSFGWGWVLKPAGYVYTYMCMAYATYG